MIDWWKELFEEILHVALWNLGKIEHHCDGSSQSLSLLMEAADHYQFIQQAYDEWCRANEHVGIVVCD